MEAFGLVRANNIVGLVRNRYQFSYLLESVYILTLAINGIYFSFIQI